MQHTLVIRPMRVAVAVFALVSAHVTWAQTINACGDLQNAFGPFDYRTDRGEHLRLVEGAHFTPLVEALIRGKTSTIGQDIDYTLRAFPNHHRALLAAARLGDRSKSPQPAGMNYPVDCYFERALRFRPDDVVARMLLAEHLLRTGRPDVARENLQVASRNAGDSAFTHYNAGLMYLELKDYDEALAQAHRALALGFPRPDLRDKLQAVGKWSDPDPKPTESASSAPPAGASAPGK
jgi:tetratricopeptide (TPR) repeat protein